MGNDLLNHLVAEDPLEACAQVIAVKRFTDDRFCKGANALCCAAQVPVSGWKRQLVDHCWKASLQSISPVRECLFVTDPPDATLAAVVGRRRSIALHNRTTAFSEVDAPVKIGKRRNRPGTGPKANIAERSVLDR